VALTAAATGLTRLGPVVVRAGGRLDDGPLGHGGLFGRHVLLLVLDCVAHRFSPPSRAPSAIAATRPAKRLPPRSNTTAATPAFLARSATSSPTLRALAVLSPSKVRRSDSRVDAEATVWPLLSSTTCTKTCRAERVTTRRGRSVVPTTRLRSRAW